MIELFSTDIVKLFTADDLKAFADANTFANPKIISPWMQGKMTGVFEVGSASPGDTGNIQLDGNNQRILIFDNSDSRVLLGRAF
jgi:hypothetical protein